MKHFLPALIIAALTACGGGGSTDSNPQPTAAPPAASAPVTAPEPAASAPAACVPKVVTVGLFGDSSQDMMGGYGFVQANLDARFGVGATVVTNRARGGTNDSQLLAGTDGLNVWPDSALAYDVVVMNHGLNSEWLDLETFKRHYRIFGKLPNIVFETVNPSLQAWNNPAFAQAVRDVGAEMDVPVADVYAYVQGVPGWQTYFPDEVHPDYVMLSMIARDVILPAIKPMVAKLRCE